MSRLSLRALLPGRITLTPPVGSIPSLQRADTSPRLRAAHYSSEAATRPNKLEAEAIKRPNPSPRLPSFPRPLSKSPEMLAQLPYIVRRTPSLMLPVYRRTRSGGTRKDTLIKKVEGDQSRFAREITGALKLNPRDVKLNPTTRHIEVKVRRTSRPPHFVMKYANPVDSQET